MNLCFTATNILFHPFIHVYSCWDTASCCNLFQDIHLSISGRSKEELCLRCRTVCPAGKLSGHPFQVAREQKGSVFHPLSVAEHSFRCLTSCQACFFHVGGDKYLCHSELRADWPVGFSQKHQSKRLIKLNKDKFP